MLHMPCFSNGPEPGTPQYDAWLPDVRRKLDAFTHVVDYYYRKAGLAMPEPTGSDTTGQEATPADPSGNKRVLDQILLHLDCDGVDVFYLNDIRNLLREDDSPRGRGYARALSFCFKALRNGFRDRPTTAAMWAECHDPALMLDHLRGRVSDRKLRLFAVACCRRVPHLLTDRRSKMAVDVAERYSDGAASNEEFEAVSAQMRVRDIRGHYGPVAAWAVAPSADMAARNTAWNAFCDRDGMGEERYQADLLRCVSGNPFRPVELPPKCRTSTVLALAQQMYDTGDFSAMPILADALQAAGCTNADVIDHCREPNTIHVRGCWAVDLILGKL
jgi:hypothetical protein